MKIKIRKSKSLNLKNQKLVNIMGAFSDLLPREFEREMKSTWLLLNNLRDLDAEEAAGMQCVLSNELSAPADLLDNRAASVNFTYFV